MEEDQCEEMVTLHLTVVPLEKYGVPHPAAPSDISTAAPPSAPGTTPAAHAPNPATHATKPQLLPQRL
ncbi:hypothetical protein FKM82_010328 [Ascaphus truei]